MQRTEMSKLAKVERWEREGRKIHATQASQFTEKPTLTQGDGVEGCGKSRRSTLTQRS